MLKRLSMIVSLCFISVVIVACGSAGTTSSDSTPSDTTSTATAVSSPDVSVSPSATPAPMHITGLSVTVNPSTFSHLTCGVTTDLVYAAAIFVNTGSRGGPVALTWNANGTTTPGSVTFAPGDTSKTVTYTLHNVGIQYGATANPSVTLSANNSGQTITSAPIKPAGNCTFPGPFVVTGVSASVSPGSLTGIPCNTTITMVYTVTVIIAANSNGGTVTVNMVIGQYHRTGSVVFAPGTTVQHLTFTTTPTLTHTTPPPMTFTSTSPNSVSSSLVKPVGQCA
jgi:hypothetical protein